MAAILTLIAAPGTDVLTEVRVQALAAELAARGAEPGMPEWLAPGQAVDLPLDRGPVAADRQVARGHVQGLGVDVALQPALPPAQRRRQLLVADMDGTILAGESLDALAAHAGIEAEVAAITQRAMAGELAFAEAVRARVALLAGLPESAIAEALAGLSYHAGARALVATMRAHGAETVLVSGGFRQVTERVAADLGFTASHANALAIRDGRLTGEVVEPVLDRDAKTRLLSAALAERGLGAEACLAVGDGANDAGMLDQAGLGVAYHAHPALAEAADIRLDHADLTGLLYLQGYRRGEIVAG